jgi:hypothetical protein
MSRCPVKSPRECYESDVTRVIAAVLLVVIFLSLVTQL